MTIRVAVYGGKLDLADELAEEFVEPAKAAVSEAADLLLAEVEARLHRRIHSVEPAPAGEPPAFHTGELAGSFHKIPPRVRGRVASSGVQSHHPGVNREEFGKTDVRGIRTLPHPFLQPSMDAVALRVDLMLQEKFQ